MAIKLTLNAKEILDKTFPGVPRGYDPLLVDEFLDKVIKDYVTVESNYLEEASMVSKLKQEIEKLKDEKRELEIENGKYKERFSNIKATDTVTSDNIDLIKKINKYEKFIYQMGYNPKNIK